MTDPLDDLDALLALGGPAPDHIETAERLCPLLVGVDQGADHLAAAGLIPHLLVGDLDSVSEATRQAVDAAGGEIRLFPRDKDHSDLALALDLLAERRPGHYRVIAGSGPERLDHLLVNLAVMAADRGPVRVSARLGPARVEFVRGHRRLEPGRDQTLTLLPLGGPAHGVRTSGVRWDLDGETLDPLSSRGLSNRTEAEVIDIEVGEGVVAVIAPGSSR